MALGLAEGLLLLAFVVAELLVLGGIILAVKWLSASLAKPHNTYKPSGHSPFALIILDGYGENINTINNAVALANTSAIDDLKARYPHALLETSGLSVGLPEGEMGNSEVGHLNIGGGRVVRQSVVRINYSIEEKSFFANEALIKAVDFAKNNNSRLHLMGLISNAVIHSSVGHLYALLELARQKDLKEVYIHAITDGRDSPPQSGRTWVRLLLEKIEQIGVGRIATICGRYYAMDRDKNWERIARAHSLYTEGKGINVRDPIAAIEDSYRNGITDEFIEPVVLVDEQDNPVALIDDTDVVIFFNFRADRSRQITRAFMQNDFKGFERNVRPDIKWASLTEHNAEFYEFNNLSVAFGLEKLKNTLGEVLAQRGLRQLRIAETEKYAHVTFFFSGGREEVFENEDRYLVASPKVATYDLQPEMSAYPVTEELLKRMGEYDFIVLNFANPDMVGHTGKLDAAIKAIEAVDFCLKDILKAVKRLSSIALIIADHGNAEEMSGKNQTSHTTNPVPCILFDPRNKLGKVNLRKGGALCDVAPTILEILGIVKPDEMTGKSLLVKARSLAPIVGRYRLTRKEKLIPKKPTSLRLILNFCRHLKKDMLSGKDYLVFHNKASLGLYYFLLEVMGLSYAEAEKIGLKKLISLWIQYFWVADAYVDAYGQLIPPEELRAILERSKEEGTFPGITLSQIEEKGVTLDDLKALSMYMVYPFDERSAAEIVMDFPNKAEGLITEMPLSISQRDFLKKSLVGATQDFLASYIKKRDKGYFPQPSDVLEIRRQEMVVPFRRFFELRGVFGKGLRRRDVLLEDCQLFMSIIDDLVDVEDDWQKQPNFVLSIARHNYPDEFKRIENYLGRKRIFAGLSGQIKFLFIAPRTIVKTIGVSTKYWAKAFYRKPLFATAVGIFVGLCYFQKQILMREKKNKSNSTFSLVKSKSGDTSRTTSEPSLILTENFLVSEIERYLRLNQARICKIVRRNLKGVLKKQLIKEGRICQSLGYILGKTLAINFAEFGFSFGDNKNTGFALESGVPKAIIEPSQHVWLTFYYKGQPIRLIELAYSCSGRHFRNKILFGKYDLEKYNYLNNETLLKEVIKDNEFQQIVDTMDEYSDEYVWFLKIIGIGDFDYIEYQKNIVSFAVTKLMNADKFDQILPKKTISALHNAISEITDGKKRPTWIVGFWKVWDYFMKVIAIKQVKWYKYIIKEQENGK
ncbi:2,3-bisphosphoglycerate-independent phosphoglycerate mutase [bacterium]|nr:MAG: 2,3-bisphosphoglycerate-independent phosphoglycerate mutase [bacterium]